MIVELNSTAVQVEVSIFSLLRKPSLGEIAASKVQEAGDVAGSVEFSQHVQSWVWFKQHMPVTLTSGVWGSRVRSSRSPSHRWSYTERSRPVRDTCDPVWKTNQPHNKSKSRLLKWKGFALTVGACLSVYQWISLASGFLHYGRTNYLLSMTVTREGGIPKTSQLCRSSFFRISPWL